MGIWRQAVEFLARFGGDSTIVAWDLFNEAYGSLGPDGGHPEPQARDPVSPNYPDEVVHAFLHDLYATAKSAAPRAWFTVSDGNLYVQPVPDLSRFDDILDFYDVHIYDDQPMFGDLGRKLDKPYMVGEAGASLKGDHLHDQSVEPAVVQNFPRARHRLGRARRPDSLHFGSKHLPGSARSIDAGQHRPL